MIIFINGSINSGKSTISKLLAKKLDRTAILEIDELRNFIPFISLEKSIPINLENACLLIKNFVKNKFNVIIPYPISQINYQYVSKQLKDMKKDLYFFTLNFSLNIILKNRGKRELNNWEKNRIKFHYKNNINNPSFGEIIDNSTQKPEQTVKIIMENIMSQKIPKLN